jgi:hypothetical protein
MTLVQVLAGMQLPFFTLISRSQWELQHHAGIEGYTIDAAALEIIG